MQEHSSNLEQGQRKGVEQKGPCILYLEGSINANLSVKSFISVYFFVGVNTHPHAGCQTREGREKKEVGGGK